MSKNSTSYTFKYSNSDNLYCVSGSQTYLTTNQKYQGLTFKIFTSDGTDVTFSTSADADADVRVLTSADADADVNKLLQTYNDK